MGYEEQLIMQANMAKKQQNQNIAEGLAEGVLDVGVEVMDMAIDGVDVAADMADTVADGVTEAVAEGADVADGIVEGLAESADELPVLAVVGIIAGIVAIAGGVVWLAKKIFGRGK